jgi:hypothetical protein
LRNGKFLIYYSILNHNESVWIGYGEYVYDNKFFRYEGEWKDGKKAGK